MVALAVLAVLAQGACTDEGGPTVATAGGTPSASPATDSVSKELQFVDCMRREGITDMPDPVPGDTSGRSAVRYALDVMGKGSDDTFQTALDVCVTLLPPAPAAEPPTAEKLDAYAQFAQCMRDNGVPEFPDSGPNGEPRYFFIAPGGNPSAPVERVTNVDGTVVLNIDDPLIRAAFEGCQSKLPASG